MQSPHSHLNLDDDNTIEFLEKHFLSTNRELANQNTSNVLLQRENARLREEKRTDEARIDELEKKLRATERRHLSLQTSLEDTKSELHRMTRHIEKSTIQSESYQRLHKDWKRKYHELTVERDSYVEKCQRVEKELRRERLGLEDEKTTSNTLRSSITELKDELANVQHQQNEALMEYNSGMEALREQNNFLQDKVAKYKRKAKKLISRQRQRDSQEGALQDQLQEELQEALTSLNTTNSRLKQLTEKHNEVHLNHMKLSGEIQDKDSQIDLLKQEVSSLKSLVTQLQNYVSESDKTKNILTREISLKDQQLKKRNDFIRKFISNVPGATAMGASLTAGHGTGANLLGSNGGAFRNNAANSPKSPLRFRSSNSFDGGRY
mmetsp:Transcript_2694/g.10354  ORF Transcript_2694/g.10354 Transcript_2694/m.10354 type:complete len:379 (+) Transcript_2694:4047-5183(+)